MDYKLSIHELGQSLQELTNNYDITVTIKQKLSGGFLTINGKAVVTRIPNLTASCGSKNTNIIELRVFTNNEEGSLIKITGIKNQLFNVNLSSTRFKELSLTGLNLNQVKVNNEESKLRIDEDIIFTIKDNVDNINKIINKCL